MALVFVAAALLAVLFGATVLVGVVAFVVRAAVWIVLLPFRLLFLAVGLPLLIVGSVGAVVFTAVAGSLLVGAGILAAVLASAFLPVVLVIFAVWALVRLARRPVAA